MTMLPEVDQQSYDDYERQRLQEDMQRQQAQFSLQSVMNEKIAGLQCNGKSITVPAT